MINTVVRLKHLRDCMVLQQDPKTAYGEFDMYVWGRSNNGETMERRKILSCGFAGCALGNAALYPPLRRMGLRVLVSPDSRFGEIFINGKSLDNILAGSIAQGAAPFFGIKPKECDDLFDPNKYKVMDIKPRHVIKKIDKLIKKYSK